MASFGFSVGDIVMVGTLAWNVYKACKNAPSEFQEVAREVVSLHAAVKDLEEEASKPDTVFSRTGEQRQKELKTLVQNIGQVLSQLERLVSKYNSISTTDRRKRDVVRFRSEGLEDIRSKVMLHTSAVNLFVVSLSAASLGRIESKLDEIVKELQRGERDTSTIAVSDDEDDPAAQAQWRALRKELVEDGFRQDDVDSHKAWIKAKLRYRIANRQDKITEDIKVPGELSAGAKETEPPSHAGPLSHSAHDQGLAMPEAVRPQAPPTLINLLAPPSTPGTPDSLTSMSSASSLHSMYANSTLSTSAIKDGHIGISKQRGDVSASVLEAERADRISRLAGLERVAVATPPRQRNSGSGLPDVMGHSTYGAQGQEAYSPPPAKLRRSPSISSITSIHSDISEHDSYGNLTKRTITTTTTTVYSVSATDESGASSDRDYVSSPHSPSGRMSYSNIPTKPKNPPESPSMIAQFATKGPSNTQKKYTCQTCGKRWNRENNLRRHQKVHQTASHGSDADTELRVGRRGSLTRPRDSFF